MGDRLLTASEKTARMWDVRVERPIGDPVNEQEYLTKATASASSDIAIFGWNMVRPSRSWTEYQATENLFGTPTEVPFKDRALRRPNVGAAFVSDNGLRTLEIAKGKYSIVDQNSGKSTELALQPGQLIESASFDTKGERVFLLSKGGEVELCDALSGACARGQRVAGDQILAASSGTEADIVVTAVGDKVFISNAQTGALISKLQGNSDLVSAAGLDSSGGRIATASTDNVQVWDTRSGMPIGKPLRHETNVLAVAFDYAGKYVVTTADDDMVRIWNALPTGENLVSRVRSILGKRAPKALEMPGPPFTWPKWISTASQN
jgi:WD40 repeat protein